MWLIICWNFLRWFLLVCGGMVSIVRPHQQFKAKIFCVPFFCVTRAQAGISWHNVCFLIRLEQWWFLLLSSLLPSCLWFNYRSACFSAHATCSHCCGTKFAYSFTRFINTTQHSFTPRCILFIFWKSSICFSFIHTLRTYNKYQIIWNFSYRALAAIPTPSAFT